MNDTHDTILRQIPGAILPWYGTHARDLPWRRTSRPYEIWLSEVMLQQTRVEAVRGYYSRFLAALPTIAHLAQVEEDRLLKLWEGLGYYSRAKNLKRAAQVIQSQYGGQFPRTYGEILSLPGIGPYTAAAIASICFSLPCPAIDGNVLRVYARVLTMEDCVDLPAVKQAVTEALSPLYQDVIPGDLNQALMELGALICLPNGAPQCNACPLASLCLGKAAGRARAYPVKAKKKPRRVEEKTVFILTVEEDSLAVEKREENGLLAGLWALPNVTGSLTEEEALALATGWGVHPIELIKSREKKHIFTHVEWHMRGFYLKCRTKSPAFTWATSQERSNRIALPTAFRQFLEE